MLIEAFVGLDDMVDTPVIIPFSGRCKKDVDEYLAHWMRMSENPEASIKLCVEYSHTEQHIVCWYYYNDDRQYLYNDDSESVIGSGEAD